MTHSLLDSLRALVRPGTLRRSAGLVGATALVGLLSACPKGDVGAPCNHGKVEPPPSDLVTFPALSCNELLCIYADSKEPPERPCTTAAECNEVEPSVNRFTCDTNTSRCELRIEYVLERSMCSKRCSSDDDCKDGGIGEKTVVENSKCATGFACASIQTLGEFCCEKLCVCRDDLDGNKASEIQAACLANDQPGCCDLEMPPAACGPG